MHCGREFATALALHTPLLCNGKVFRFSMDCSRVKLLCCLSVAGQEDVVGPLAVLGLTYVHVD